MEISYDITLGTETFDEEQIQIDKHVRKKIAAESVLEGSIRIKSGEKQFLIEDELIPWIQNLCLKPIPFLINGDAATIYYFSREGTLTVLNNGQELTFLDNFNTTIILPFKSTVKALGNCGIRFMETMASIKKDDLAFMNAINSLNLLKVLAEDSLKIMYYR